MRSKQPVGFHTRLPVEVREAMEQLAKIHDRTLNGEIIQACKAWILVEQESLKLIEMAKEEKSMDKKQFIECEQCGKPSLLESTPQDDDLQTRHYYTCPSCGFSDVDVPVAQEAART